MTSKLKSQRPGTSYRVNDDENFGSETERRSKIPRLPKRTCSLEGKQSTQRRGRSSSRLRSSNASMIPRLEWKKNKKSSTPETPNRERHKSKAEPLQPETLKSPPPAEGAPEIEETNKKSAKSSHSKEIALESKINEDFINFKKNVLRIPEYWTDAGQTVTNILKNAINIVSKEYPSADVDSFEMEIQNILKATELVKQQILTKTESIINQASKIYSEKNMGEGEPSEKEILKIMKKMEELRQEVSARKNVFGDLLECSNEMKQLVDIEKSLKENSKEKSTKLYDSKNYKEMESRKTKMKSEVESAVEKKKRESMVMQSCGDVCREPAVYTAITAGKPSGESPTMFTDKSSQTMNFWTAELYRREEDLTILNNQIRELHQLCKDHISKFKSFNLQIKLRGICNKAQNLSVCKELQILNDEKLQLAEKNNRLLFYNKDLESAIKQRDMDLHQKDRLISQQKKLLHVRDELIEMLKCRCNIEELEQV